MQKKKIILVLALAIMLFVGINSVSAVCYSYESNGKTHYAAAVDKSLSNVKTVDDKYCETYENLENAFVSCGEGKLTNIPATIPKVVSIAYMVIQIAIPIVLVIMGMLDLFKGITAQKEEEIKKGQQALIKRLIYAGLIFFVFSVVKIVISFSAESTDTYIVDCAECFINNKCS